MDRHGKTITLVLLFVAVIANVAVADDTVRFRVSCTIPAIPGVNAPLVEKETNSTIAPVAFVQPKEELDAANLEESSGQKNENSESEQLEKTEEKPTYLVKTIYSK